MIMNWMTWLRTERKGGSEGSELASERPREGDGAPPESPLIDSDETLVGEFGRARRYEHPLAIVVATPVPLEREDGRRSADGRSAPEGTDILPLLAGAGMREGLRESDVVCYRPADKYFVLGFPQADTAEATHAMRRVGALFRSRLRIELVAGAVHFPEDGLTLEDLVATARARERVLEEQAPEPSSGADGASREAPSRRTAPARSRRKPRTAAPSGIAHEAAGGE